MRWTFLDEVMRKMRIRRILPIIRQSTRCTLLDVGCGWDASLLKSVEQYVDSGVGVDFKAPELKSAKLKTIPVTFDDKLPFDDDSFDVVTLMAVLEHLEKPLEILREIRRVLRKHDTGCGILVGTVPSKAAKPVLEFLAYKLRIISATEISDHKKYYNKRDLIKILTEAGFGHVTCRYFQFGMNNFFTARVWKGVGNETQPSVT